MVTLDSRLNDIASLIGNAETVADIGCDHGLLSVYLLQSGAAEKVYAVDISKESIRKTKMLAVKNGIDFSADKLHVIQSDGFTNIPQSVDVAVIAGMGADAMFRILTKAEGYAKRLVLQPVAKPERLRAWLYENGYAFIDERMAKIGHRYFCSMSISKELDNKEKLSLSFIEIELGLVLLKNKEPLLLGYIDKMLKQESVNLRNIGKSDKQSESCKKTNAKIKAYEEAREWLSSQI